jgi:hypothetical protein
MPTVAAGNATTTPRPPRVKWLSLLCWGQLRHMRSAAGGFLLEKARNNVEYSFNVTMPSERGNRLTI